MNKRNFKIALVSDAFGHHTEGNKQIVTNGTVKFTSQLTQAAERYRAEVRLITTSPSYASVDHGAISILPVEKIILPNLPLSAQTHGGVATKGIRQYLGNFQPDVVSLSTIGAPNASVAQKWAQEKGITTVATIHSHPGKLVEHALVEMGTEPFEIARLTKDIRSRILRLSSTLKGIIVRSQRSQSELEGWGMRGDFHVLHGGIDKGVYRPAASINEVSKIRSKYNIGQDDFVILFVGRFCPAKESEAVLKAYRGVKKTNKSIRLVTVGSHSYYADKASALSAENIILLGELPADEVAKVMRAADIGIAPSPHETFGQAIAEMMASGLACVLPREGGHLSFASPESAVLLPIFNDESANQWIDSISKLLNDSERRKEIGKLARSQIHNVNDSFRDFIRIHKAVVNGSTFT